MGRFSMMVCPLCGRSRKVYSKRWEDPEIRWDYWDEGSPIIQIREGGGKKPKEEGEATINIGKPKKRGWAPGAGFKTIETLTLEEAMKDERYKKYVKKMFKQIKKIYKIISNIEKS